MEHDYGKGYKAGYDLGFSNGLNVAWETARELFNPVYNGGYNTAQLYELFRFHNRVDILNAWDVKEVIRVFKEYNEEHEFKVGDEVTSKEFVGALTFIITYIDDKGMLYGLDKSNGCTVSCKDPCRFGKTGRYWGIDTFIDAFKNDND